MQPENRLKRIDVVRKKMIEVLPQDTPLMESKDGIPLNPGSPFNIKEDSASLSNFSPEEVAELTGQHVTDAAVHDSQALKTLLTDEDARIYVTTSADT